MDSIIDLKQRQRALDASQSFIVQAPAGSGKTGLLIQRILVLLANVSAPEQIVAVTFTRKAAAEMRTRLMSALYEAKKEEPTEDYKKTTWQLARKVLEQDQQHSWHLLDNPNRLRILTIDALSARITRYAPILSRFGADMSVLQDPIPCYRTAARQLLQSLNDDVPWQEALEILLLHLDNHQEWLEELFIQMLARRDQWLPFVIGHHDLNELRETLESALQHVVGDAIQHCISHIPKTLQRDLDKMIVFSQHHNGFTDTDNQELQWRYMADLFLNKTGEWRKAITKKQGFPAPSSAKDKDEKEHLQFKKQQMLDLLTALGDFETWRVHLRELQMSPPTTYNASQWQIVSALIELLPILAAQLTLAFKEIGSVDFIEIAQGALKALGSHDDPTAVALNLDYQIQHLLVDEFQDTSVTQFQLVELLTAGWQKEDGRTLFLVGDPMQSIYRFREAKVGLFLRAKQFGLGDISLESLVLQSNFRSQQGVVDWCNEIFVDVFPPEEDMTVGAIPYSKAQATHDKLDLSVIPHALVDESNEQEAQRVLQLITDFQIQNSRGTVAILARSRSHLANIIPTLERADVKFQAVDVASLAYCSVIQDLLALTRGLTHLADKVAWLAILRAPWCGLTLAELHALVSEKKGTVWECCQDFETTQLSENGKIRLRKIFPILQHAVLNKQRSSLRDWVSLTWQQLNGPSCCQQKDLTNAERFFALLDEVDVGGELIEFSTLESKLYSLFAAPDPDADGSLQLMTIHRAKGLEFDCVIIPGLERRPASDSASLMLWQARPRGHHQTDLILGPIKSSTENNDPIYDYLRYQERLKSQHEQVRLLYVAATRAKQELHLLGTVQTKDDEIVLPASGSFLGLLWPHLEELYQPVNSQISRAKTETVDRKLIRLTSDFFQPDTDAVESIHESKTQLQQPLRLNIEDESNLLRRQVGILIHQSLQHISQSGISQWESSCSKERQQQWHYQLAPHGFSDKDIDEAIQEISMTLTNVINDPQAKWILDPTHADAHSEYPLTYFANGQVQNIILDRTFIDPQGTRWIIDYKTTHKPDDLDLDTFLTTQQQRHAAQLTQYATAMQMLENRPIRAGLYFPTIPAWHEVNLAQPEGQSLRI